MVDMLLPRVAGGGFEQGSQRCYNLCDAASGRVNARRCCAQEEVLSGKAKAQANVEELERLIPLLKEVRRARLPRST